MHESIWARVRIGRDEFQFEVRRVEGRAGPWEWSTGLITVVRGFQGPVPTVRSVRAGYSASEAAARRAAMKAARLAWPEASR